MYSSVFSCFSQISIKIRAILHSLFKYIILTLYNTDNSDRIHYLNKSHKGQTETSDCFVFYYSQNAMRILKWFWRNGELYVQKTKQNKKNPNCKKHYNQNAKRPYHSYPNQTFDKISFTKILLIQLSKHKKANNNKFSYTPS